MGLNRRPIPIREMIGTGKGLLVRAGNRRFQISEARIGFLSVWNLDNLDQKQMG